MIRRHEDRYGRTWIYTRDFGWIPEDWPEDEPIQMPTITSRPSDLPATLQDAQASGSGPGKVQAFPPARPTR